MNPPVLTVIPAYAAILGLIFLLLSVRVIAFRRRHRVAFGHVGSPDLERRVRIHGNFAEYVPLALLLLGFAEFRGAAPLLLHLGAISLLVGRLGHAIGLSSPSRDDIGRIVGMTGSQTAILLAALLIGWSYI